MRKPPKTIQMVYCEANYWTPVGGPSAPGDPVQYIRADLVKGLVEALGKMLEFHFPEDDDQTVLDARAALKAYEEGK